MQQVYRMAAMTQCNFNKVAKYLDGCFCIKNVKHPIHSANVYTSVLFMLAKVISKAKNLILFPYCLYQYFFFLGLSTFIFCQTFSTAFLLSSQLAKKLYASDFYAVTATLNITSKNSKFTGNTKQKKEFKQNQIKKEIH